MVVVANREKRGGLVRLSVFEVVAGERRGMRSSERVMRTRVEVVIAGGEGVFCL